MDTVEYSTHENFQEKFVDSLKFLNKKGRSQALTRTKDIEKYLEKLSKYPIGFYQLEDLPRQEFRASLQRYVLSFFGDAIYHSCFSVEVALLIRLDERLPEEEKIEINKKINSKSDKPMSFTFGAMFNLAQKRQLEIIKDKKLRKKIEILLEKRNRYIHVTNYLSGLILTFKKQVVPEIESKLKEIETLKDIELFGKILNSIGLANVKGYLTEQLYLLKTLPDFSWCTKDKHLENIEKQINDYVIELNKLTETIDVTTRLQQLRATRKIKGLTKKIMDTTFIKSQSLEILEQSFEILVDLDFV